jgi:uncharacterized protein (DUF2236 family)
LPSAPPISHRVNAERLAVLGWGRAILMQLAHPLVAAGVYDHSSFRATPWAAAQRLHATIHAMVSLTFGTDAEREHALHGIRTIHRRVHGTLPEAVGPLPAGTCYSAEDPALVLWVHATLLESIPLVYERVIAPLTSAQRDAYCDEAAWVAIALGAREEQVPRTAGAVAAYLAEMYASGVITVGPQARELAAAVLSPRIGRLAPPVAGLHRLITAGLLPAHLRDQYGLPWSPRHDRRLARGLALSGALRRAVPRRLAIWPAARD